MTAPEDTAPEDTAPEDAAPEDTAPEDTAGTSSRLEALGAVAPPPPSEAFLAQLTAIRLDRRPPASARDHRRFRLPVLLPAAAVAAAVVGFVLVSFGHHDTGSTVVLRTAVDASVELNGQAGAAQPGQVLHEGATISTGPTGSATVDGTTLGPDEQAVVQHRRLVRLARQRRRREAAAPNATTTGPPDSTAPPAGSPSWSGLKSLPREVQLRAGRGSNGALHFSWTQWRGADFGAYALVREDQTVVARRYRVDRTAAFDQDAPPERTRYIVIVFDSSGHAVARSQPVDV